MDDWRIGSLFAGIGGLELGLERAGLGKTAVQVECDEYATQILQTHWPNAKRYGDVREVGAKELGGLEVLCGGFPCQDISNANQHAQGLDGARSGLWSEYARLIGEVRPRIVVVENVAALLRRGIDRVLGDLASLGYDAEWGVFSASGVGAHHLRERIFVVAYPHGFGHLDCGPGIFSTENREQTLLELGCGGPAMADANCPRLEGRQEHRVRSSELPLGAGLRSKPGAWLPEPLVGRVANGIPDRVDRLRCLGNAVVPQVAEYVGGLIVTALQSKVESVTPLDAKQHEAPSQRKADETGAVNDF